MTASRQCTKCLQSLPETAEHFRPNPNYRGGLMTWCRACEKAYRSAHAKSNREKINVYVREFNQTHAEAQREKWNRQQRERRDRDRGAYRAVCRERYARLGKTLQTVSVGEAARILGVRAAAVETIIEQGSLMARRYHGADQRLSRSQVEQYRRDLVSERPSLIRDIQEVGIHRAFCSGWRLRQPCEECDRLLGLANAARARIGLGPREDPSWLIPIRRSTHAETTGRTAR